MDRLLIVSDDLTGALDTCIGFAARHISTRVMVLPDGDFEIPDADVLVLSTESRHLSAEKAYDVVYRAASQALRAGFTHIYKKTDSALRGNIGAELKAVLDASGFDFLPFIPAFPKMDRVTKNGICYICGVPVAESAFGQDPFDPVKHSKVTEIIKETADVPCTLHASAEFLVEKGIHIYDAETDGDLFSIANALGKKGLRISAGCAGFTPALSEILEFPSKTAVKCSFYPSFIIACGSMNPATLRQIDFACENGFDRIGLTPEEKLGFRDFDIDCLKNRKLCILDANDRSGAASADDMAKSMGLSFDETRKKISESIGMILKNLFDSGVLATLLCTGGDTLSAFLRVIGMTELIPVRELFPGVVLTCFDYRGRTYPLITKSGGFGQPDLFCRLSEIILAE